MKWGFRGSGTLGGTSLGTPGRFPQGLGGLLRVHGKAADAHRGAAGGKGDMSQMVGCLSCFVFRQTHVVHIVGKLSINIHNECYFRKNI